MENENKTSQTPMQKENKSKLNKFCCINNQNNKRSEDSNKKCEMQGRNSGG